MASTIERLAAQIEPYLFKTGEQTMAITTLSAVKSYLGISGTDQDGKITALIPFVEEDYLNIRNAPWSLDELGAIVYPTGSDITAAKMIGEILKREESGEYGDISSERIGSYNVSYRDAQSTWRGYSNSTTAAIKKYIRGV